jgi:hypothetical protein
LNETNPLRRVPITRAIRELNSILSRKETLVLTRNKKEVLVLCPEGTEEYEIAMNLGR